MNSKDNSQPSKFRVELGEHQVPLHPGKLKVAHIASGDLWAGAEVQLFTLAAQLQQTPNIELHICLLNFGELYRKLASLGISVSVFDESELGTLSIGFELYRKLRQFKPDVIHTHRVKENILGSVITLFLKNTKSIRTVHGAPEHRHGFLKPHKRLQNYLDYACGHYLQHEIVAVSEDLARKLCTSFPASKVSTILNGVDCAAIELMAAKPYEPIYNESPGVKVCFGGRLAPVKRLDLWLETASILVNKSSRQFSFYIIGDGPERPDLEALASKLNISLYVHFIGETDNVPAILKQMDILLITSDHEGLPMIMLEALCVKTLIVAHDVGGISGLLANNEAGYLVARHSSNCYAEEILRSLEEPREANKKKEIGYSQVNARYAARECSLNYVTKYLELSRH